MKPPILAAMLLVATIGQSDTVHAADTQPKSCAIAAHRVICAGGAERGADLLAALAAPESASAFRQALQSADDYRDRTLREGYRRSLEAVRRRVNRHARRMERRWRRGRLSSDAYAQLRAQYQAALENYRIAIRIYREGLWADPEPTRPPR